jgi:hypothetical protein
VIALKQALQDWKDFDEAQRHLAVCLGLSNVESDGPKGLFWSRNPMSLMLCTILAQMVQVGVLEQNHEDQYRWNPAFPAELEEYYHEWRKNLKRGSNDAEPNAAPNGGPATQLGNSNATEGPPSVS